MNFGLLFDSSHKAGLPPKNRGGQALRVYIPVGSNTPIFIRKSMSEKYDKSLYVLVRTTNAGEKADEWDVFGNIRMRQKVKSDFH